MLNALIIVWRESLEALLVIGVLSACIARQDEPAKLRRGLWVGTASGMGLAALLGAAAFAVQSQFIGASLEVAQLAMTLLAAALMVQMVFWMHRHGRHLKRQWEEKARRAEGVLGIGVIAALAVAREGAETMIFLSGVWMEASGTQRWSMLGASAAGVALAVATSWALARGARFLNVRTLFRASEVLLLLIAGALLAHGVDHLIGMAWLPPLIDPIWDTSALLSDGHGIGRLLADFAGYRARPSGLLLLSIIAFWGWVLWHLRRFDSISSPDAR